ncbi:hypothetical protein EV363DRAFT_1291947 [Boletus edulis]|nr:hypothetical protein EV363DRAFT_1291947 [Boletus edulis]
MESSQTSDPSSETALVVLCKRRITELEQELEDARGVHDARSKGPNVTPLRLGRCIRRLVTLRDRVEDLVSEADRRACLDGSNTQNFSEEEDRLYSAYKELLRWWPSLRRVFESETDFQHLAETYRDVSTIPIVSQVNTSN